MPQISYGYSEYRDIVRWSPHVLHKHLLMTKGVDQFLIGIEHEMECGGFDEDNMLELSTVMGFPCDQTHDIICASDGSLTSGYETITQPANYSFHMYMGKGNTPMERGYNWEAFLKRADELGYTGEGEYDSSGNIVRGGHAGTHFNVSRKSLMGKEDTEQNLLLIFLNNRDWIMNKFSRRANTSDKFYYCFFNDNFPKIKPTDVENDFERVKRMLQEEVEHCRDHYSAVNLAKPKVIEFRFMASTTFYKWFVAGLQFIVMLCYCAKYMSMREAAGVRFPFFLQMAKANDFTQFVEYCRYHRIDISPIDYAY